MDKLKCHVVMLPSNQKAIERGMLVKYYSPTNTDFNMIGIVGLPCNDSGTWFEFNPVITIIHADKDKIISWPTDRLSHQHLYFTSNREIKEGDWIINVIQIDHILENNLWKANKSNIFICCTGPKKNSIRQIKFSDIGKTYYKKVEATTDPTLGLQLIPQSFVEKYVEKQGKIEEVMIEMEICDCRRDNNGTCIEVPNCMDWAFGGKIKQPEGIDCNTRPRIKTRKDGTVICSSVKDTWTREEVIALHKENCERLTNQYISSDIDWIEDQL